MNNEVRRKEHNEEDEEGNHAPETTAYPSIQLTNGGEGKRVRRATMQEYEVQVKL